MMTYEVIVGIPDTVPRCQFLQKRDSEPADATLVAHVVAVMKVQFEVVDLGVLVVGLVDVERDSVRLVLQAILEAKGLCPPIATCPAIRGAARQFRAAQRLRG